MMTVFRRSSVIGILVFAVLVYNPVALHVVQAQAETGANQGTVALLIDYSNGVQKTFLHLHWRDGMAVPDVLETASSISPGLNFERRTTLDSDRGGRSRWVITSIDGVKAMLPDQEWLVWINARFIGNELADSGNPTKEGAPIVKPGDVVTIKMATVQSNPRP